MCPEDREAPESGGVGDRVAGKLGSQTTGRCPRCQALHEGHRAGGKHKTPGRISHRFNRERSLRFGRQRTVGVAGRAGGGACSCALGLSASSQSFGWGGSLQDPTLSIAERTKSRQPCDVTK